MVNKRSVGTAFPHSGVIIRNSRFGQSFSKFITKSITFSTVSSNTKKTEMCVVYLNKVLV